MTPAEATHALRPFLAFGAAGEVQVVRRDHQEAHAARVAHVVQHQRVRLDRHVLALAGERRPLDRAAAVAAMRRRVAWCRGFESGDRRRPSRDRSRRARGAAFADRAFDAGADGGAARGMRAGAAARDRGIGAPIGQRAARDQPAAALHLGAQFVAPPGDRIADGRLLLPASRVGRRRTTPSRSNSGPWIPSIASNSCAGTQAHRSRRRWPGRRRAAGGPRARVTVLLTDLTDLRRIGPYMQRFRCSCRPFAFVSIRRHAQEPGKLFALAREIFSRSGIGPSDW
jgi:hypothetical protein